MTFLETLFCLICVISVSIQTVGNPNRSSPYCHGNTSGFTFSGSGIDTRRKTCASVIIKETGLWNCHNYISLQSKFWASAFRCSLTWINSLQETLRPSATKSRNLQNNIGLRNMHHFLNLQLSTFTEVRYYISQQQFRRTRFQYSLIIVSMYKQYCNNDKPLTFKCKVSNHAEVFSHL